MKEKRLLAGIMLIALTAAGQPSTKTDRATWLFYLDKVCRPVMMHTAAGTLKANLPRNLSKRVDNAESRQRAAYLEAFARTLAGIAPWLNGEGGSSSEVALRNQYRQWALQGIAHSVNPSSADYMVWQGGQPLVDASFYALGLVRCPWLWNNLDTLTKQRVVNELLSTRATVPVYTNWLLFTGMIETFFAKYGYPYDKVRIDFGLKEFENHWYVGDGLFSDGNDFAMDYYNSYVIQPYINTILQTLAGKTNTYNRFAGRMDKISRRYAEIQERMIAADGSFPLLGRSLVYRGGAFQHLADMALRRQLPASLAPAQVRGALQAVMVKTLAQPANFDAGGWLTIGVAGNQPDVADVYNNTGSLYLCTAIFLPLGLPDSDPFWAAPSAPWTAVKAWSGQDFPNDHALHLN